MLLGLDSIKLSNKNPLSVLYCAGSLIGKKKLTKNQVDNANLIEYKDSIVTSSEVLQRLRLSSTLLLGLVVIYRRKTEYLIQKLKKTMNQSRVEAKFDFKSEIDLPVNKRKTIIDLPKQKEMQVLSDVLNEAFCDESLYQNDFFVNKLKSLLEREMKTELGFSFDISGEDSQKSIEERKFKNTNEIESQTPSTGKINRGKFFDSEEIDFDLGSFGILDDNNNGGDLLLMDESDLLMDGGDVLMDGEEEIPILESPSQKKLTELETYSKENEESNLEKTSTDLRSVFNEAETINRRMIRNSERKKKKKKETEK